MARPRDNRRKPWSTRKPDLFPQLSMEAMRRYKESKTRVFTDPVQIEAQAMGRLGRAIQLGLKRRRERDA